MKIATIIGARPQFIKAAMVSRAIREHNLQATSDERRVTDVLIHTGQHYDHEMDKVFFDQLDIPIPDYHLGVGSGNQGDQTARMLAAIEKVLLKEKPDAVLVYGDTNSTLAGALAAAKLQIPVGHVEGGMRSFNRQMPEEINRVVAGHVAKWHFCPTETAVKNLNNEGISKGVYLVGDVMYDAVYYYKKRAQVESKILERSNLREKNYILATVHRAENTDNSSRLRNIIEALVEISKELTVVFPIHPRTKLAIERSGLISLITDRQSFITTEPLPYLDLLCLEESATVIVTDSGGIQKEAFWMGVPCVTVRDETEWLETVESGLNRLTGSHKEKIVSATHLFMNKMADCKNTAVKESAVAGEIVGILVSR